VVGEIVLATIVFWRESPWPSIWRVGPGATRPVRILRNQQNAKRPRLSPDGRWVAFDGAPPGKEPMTDFDIQVSRLDGSHRRTVTRTVDWDLEAQWSPDAEWLAFTRVEPSPHDCRFASIWLVRPNGRGAHRVARGCSARWSRDGTKLAYTARSGYELRVLTLANGRSRRVVGTRYTSVGVAGWSSDDRQLVTNYNAGTSRVYIVDVRSGRARKLTNGVATAWSRDGSQILCTTMFEGPLFVLRPDGTHRRMLNISGADPDFR
jgi:Tol biopolymer transport system component